MATEYSLVLGLALPGTYVRGILRPPFSGLVSGASQSSPVSPDTLLRKGRDEATLAVLLRRPVLPAPRCYLKGPLVTLWGPWCASIRVVGGLARGVRV